MVRLEWDGTKLFLGTLMVAEVHEAGMLSGQRAAFALSGQPIVVVEPLRTWADTNARARARCLDAARAALHDAGVVVEN